MSRTVLRFVEHTITHAPEGGITWEITCRAHACGAESGSQDQQDAASMRALRHTGRTGHDLFRRKATDRARVIRAVDQPGATR